MNSTTKALAHIAFGHYTAKAFDQALACYTPILHLPDNTPEDLWYAHHMLGLCYLYTKQDDKFLDHMQKAAILLSTRNESLCKLAEYYRWNKKYDDATRYARQALNNLKDPPPAGSIPILEPADYTWRPLLEFALSAFDTEDKDAAIKAQAEALITNDIPAEQKHWLAVAYTKHLHDIGTMFELFSNVKIHKIDAGFKDGEYNEANPSILFRDDGTAVMTIRILNYYILPYLYHRFMAKNKEWQFRNKLGTCILNPSNCALIAQQEVKDESEYIYSYTTRWDGYEDARLMEVDGITYAMALSSKAVKERNQPMLLTLNSELNAITDVRHILIPETATTHEKNWMPILNNKFQFVRNLDPMRIVEFDPVKGKSKTILDRKDPDYDFTRLRGGSQLVPYNNGWLCLVHEIADCLPQRTYMHRFVYLNQDFVVEQITQPMVFIRQYIEFCCGLGIKDGTAYIPFCTVDRNNYIMTVPVGEIFKHMVVLKRNSKKSIQEIAII